MARSRRGVSWLTLPDHPVLCTGRGGLSRRSPPALSHSLRSRARERSRRVGSGARLSRRSPSPQPSPTRFARGRGSAHAESARGRIPCCGRIDCAAKGVTGVAAIFPGAMNKIIMSDSDISSLPLFSRVWLAWLVWFRIVFDGLFAARVKRVAEGGELPAAPEPKQIETPKPRLPESPPAAPALQLLALLQREGRLVDFLEQDVTGFSDAEVGAAARVVHEGCRKALRAHAKLTTVRTEEEGSSLNSAIRLRPCRNQADRQRPGLGPLPRKARAPRMARRVVRAACCCRAA